MSEGCSFYTSEEVGLSTLICFKHLWTQTKETLDCGVITREVTKLIKLMPDGDEIADEPGLIYGAAGYLYVILALEKKIKSYAETDKGVLDLKSKFIPILKLLHQAIGEIGLSFSTISQRKEENE